MNFFRSISLGTCAALATPYLIWIWVNRGFITGHSFVGGDGGIDYYWLIYHFENFLNGTYPLWNPYHSWGIFDHIQIRLLGEFNPFLLLIPLLMKSGIAPSNAYLAFLFIYFGVAMAGFYCLLRLICEDRRLAFLGYVLLMFTSVFGEHIFYQTDLLFIYTPVIWFFVFFIFFARHQTDEELCLGALGAVYALMLVLTTYLPFYFLSVFSCVLLAAVVFCPHWIKIVYQAIGKLFKHHGIFSFLLMICLLMAIYPGINSSLNIRDPQNVFINERSNSQENSYNVSLERINEGALLTQGSWEEIFSDFSAGAQYSMYVSNIIFLLAFLFLFNRSNRKQRALFLIFFLLFIIAVGNVFKGQLFLYKSLFFLHFFRNYFFFIPVLLGILITFLMGELRTLLETDFSRPLIKFFYGALVMVTHAGFILFLLTLQYVPRSAFIMVILSAIWFLVLVFTGIFKERKWLFIIGLAGISLIQPLDVLKGFQAWDSRSSFIKENPYFQKDFLYTRPLETSTSPQDCYVFIPKGKEDSGFCSSRYYGQKGSYSLMQNVSKDLLKNYVSYKFILYRSTAYMDFSNPDWDKIRRTLSGPQESALVDDLAVQKTYPGKAKFITQASAALRVIHFDANKLVLQTDLPEKYFLVYNDSYHSKWRVYVDGQPSILYKANYAFKGLWVGPGRHRIEFVFGSSLERSFYFYFIFVMLAILLTIMTGFIRLRSKQNIC